MYALLLAAAASFDLVCQGTETTGMMGGGLALKDQKQAPFAEEYRIDLDAKRWCSGACSTTAIINDVSETRIRFELDKIPDFSMDTIAEVNREDGQYMYRKRAGDFVVLRLGQCEPAPFRGFPKRKF